MRIRTKSFVTCAALFLVGCSALPMFDQIEQRVVNEGKRPFRIVDDQGQLTGDLLARIETKLLPEGTAAQKHLQIMQAVNDSPIVLGNEAQVLIDGPQAYNAIFEAFGKAKHHIHIESFIFEELNFENRLSELLVLKAREGVQVRVLYDSFGSKNTPLNFFEELRSHGVQVCEFNPINPLKARIGWFINHRDHRKIVVVDGIEGYTGGINFHQVYRTGSAPTVGRRSMPSIIDGWRDTHVKLRGPVVPYLQRLFIDSWAKQNCGALPEPPESYFVQSKAIGQHTVTVIGSSPDGMLSRMYLTLLSAITNAEKSIYLTAAYFIPDPNTILALKAAARRGVDVRLLLPGISDSWLAFHAGRSHYQDLLDAGVKIYERPDVLLHAKTIVVDGAWSSIGSSNIDWRSFCHNDEVNAVFIGENFGKQMNTIFFDDLKHTHEIISDQWKQRSPKHLLLERLSRQWEYLL